jgi:hypothetical protein
MCYAAYATLFVWEEIVRTWKLVVVNGDMCIIEQNFYDSIRNVAVCDRCSCLRSIFGVHVLFYSDYAQVLYLVG